MKTFHRQRFGDVARQVAQVPGIAAEAGRRAVNATAKSGREAVYLAMRRAFDRPGDYTMRALRVEEGQSAERIEAGVMVRGRQDVAGSAIPPQSFLRAQILGGSRRWKRFEVALMKRGILPRGWYAVPGSAARLDQWGNMTGGHVVQLMAWLQLFKVANGERRGGRVRNMTPRNRERMRRGTANRFGVDVFVSSPLQAYRRGGLPFGIWQRQTNARTRRTHGAPAPVRPVVLFIRSAKYRQRLDFFGELQRHSAAQFPLELDRAMPAARRARPLKDAR